MPFPCIVGLNLLHQLSKNRSPPGFHIDLQTQRLTIGKKRIPVWSPDDLIIKIKVAYVQVIPPYTCRDVDCRVETDIPATTVPEDPLILFEPTQKIQKRLPLYLPPQLHDNQENNCLSIRVFNYSNSPCTLYEHTTLGIGTTYPAETQMVPTSPRSFFPGSHSTVCAISGTDRDQAPHWMDLSQKSSDCPRDPELRKKIIDDHIGTAHPLMTDQQFHRFRTILHKHHQSFSLHPYDLGLSTHHVHKIEIEPGQPPLQQRAYRLPMALRQAAHEKIKDLLAAGIIEESNSPWMSPCIFIQKPAPKPSPESGINPASKAESNQNPPEKPSVRLCIDYRFINRLQKKRSATNVPRISETMMARFHGCNFFSNHDLRQSFHQIPLDEESRDISSFIVDDESPTYRYRVLPMGISNGPLSLLTALHKLFGDIYQERHLAVFFDDLAFGGNTPDDVLDTLEIVCSRLESVNMKLSLDKSTFLATSITFLGSKLTPEGILPNPKKVEAATQIQPPKTLRQVQSFLGLTNFFRRWIKNYAQIANPLTELTRKDVKFQWTPERQAAFDQLKQALVTAPVLAHPDFSNKFEFYLTCDASGTQAAGVLAQQSAENEPPKPLAYYSRMFSKTESEKSATDREALAILYSYEHFRVWIYNMNCIIQTDHKALIYSLHSTTRNQTIHKLQDMLQDQVRNIQIRYYPGKINLAADALSRLPKTEGSDDETFLMEHASSSSKLKPAVSAVVSFSNPSVNAILKVPDSILDFAEIQRQCDLTRFTIIYFQEDILPLDPELALKVINLSKITTLRDNKLFYNRISPKSGRYRLFVPEFHRQVLIDGYHSHNLSGHVGVTKVVARISEYFFWPKMQQSVRSVLAECHTCAIFKKPAASPKVPLVLPPLPAAPFATIAVDYTIMPMSTQGNRYCLNIIDYLTSWLVAVPSPSMEATCFADALYKHWISIFSLPLIIISDRGTSFTAEIINVLCKRLNIKRILSAQYHASGNGRIERAQQHLKRTLGIMADSVPENWEDYLPAALLSLRTSESQTLKRSPFSLVFGTSPVLPPDMDLHLAQLRSIDADFNDPVDPEFFTDGYLARFRLSRQWVQQSSIIPRDRYKRNYDRKISTQFQFAIGDLVLINREPWTRHSYKKLMPNYYGPYQISDVTPTNLQLFPFHGDPSDTFWISRSHAKPYSPSPRAEEVQETHFPARGQRKLENRPKNQNKLENPINIPYNLRPRK